MTGKTSPGAPTAARSSGRRALAAMSDADLLAILLGAGYGRCAPDLLRRFGGLRPLLNAGPARLRSCPGIGPALAGRLFVVLELARRHFRERLFRGPALTSPELTRDYLVAELRDLPYAVFGCLFLDNRHRLIAFEILFRGTIDGASVHPREVVLTALERSAAAVILAHNHPSGMAEPSDADRRITRRLRDALALLDIRLLDHLVVGDGDCVSFAERGLL